MDDINLVKDLTILAREAGPFFFALLILVYLTSKAGIEYRKTCERKDPVPTKEEILSRRRVYYANWIFGFALVCISAGWWIVSNPAPDKHGIFEFAIQGLYEREQLQVLDDRIYVRTVVNWSERNRDAPVRTNYFALMSREPIDEEGAVYIQYTFLDVAEPVYGQITVGGELGGKRLIIEREQGRPKMLRDDLVAIKPIGPLVSMDVAPPDEKEIRLAQSSIQ